MLGNVSPKFRSSLKSIQLLALVEKPVYDKYGMDKILEPAIADIKELEKVMFISNSGISSVKLFICSAIAYRVLLSRHVKDQ